VARIGRAVALGLLDAEVLPVVTHMPGHGRTTPDSHHDLPPVDPPLNVLEDPDFAPFLASNGLPIVVPAHQVFDHSDAPPATISPTIIGLIRERIGFDGLIMTDDISMKALGGSLGDLSHRALDAGCDVVLHCNGSLAERVEVLQAAGEMTDAAQQRAERALAMRQAPQELDIEAAEAEHSCLMGGQEYER